MRAHEGGARRRRRIRRAAALVHRPTSPPAHWPTCPTCGRDAEKQHGDGCYVCAKGHSFRSVFDSDVHMETARH